MDTVSPCWGLSDIVLKEFTQRQGCAGQEREFTDDDDEFSFAGQELSEVGRERCPEDPVSIRLAALLTVSLGQVLDRQTSECSSSCFILIQFYKILPDLYFQMRDLLLREDK